MSLASSASWSSVLAFNGSIAYSSIALKRVAAFAMIDCSFRRRCASTDELRVGQCCQTAVCDCVAINDSNAYNEDKEEQHMSTLTIRNLEDALKNRLRLRAAARNRSMEEEARQILRSALQEPTRPTPDLGARIRARFAALGDVQLPIEPREAVRPPPVLAEDPAMPAVRKRKSGTPPKGRR
jgi:plasmid stability protein